MRWMRQAARVTLFVQDRDGRLETVPDLEVLHLLMQQVPMVTRNADGSRTLVFDLVDPGTSLGRPGRDPSLVPAGSPARLRGCIQALGTEARALGLTLTAALSDSAEIVAEAELGRRAPAD